MRASHGAMRPLAVLVHGWGTDGRAMQGVAARLAPWCGCVLHEIAGHGDASADESGCKVEAAAARLAGILAPARGRVRILVGWSLGGLLALRTAALAPGCVERLVLAGAFPRMTRGDGFEDGVAPAALRAMVHGFRRDPDVVLGAFAERCFSARDRAGPGSLEMLAALSASLRTGSTACKLRWLETLCEADIRADVPKVLAPVTLLHGSADEVVPPGASAWLAASCPCAERMEIAGAGHALPLTHPERLAESVRQIVQRLSQDSQ